MSLNMLKPRPNGLCPPEVIKAIDEQWRVREKMEVPSNGKTEFYLGALVAIEALGFDVPIFWALDLALSRERTS